MAVTSDLTAFGDLTGASTQDLIHTASGTEYLIFTFFNRSASTRTLTLWLNTVANANLILSAASMFTLESIVLEIKMGNGDKLHAEGSAAASIGVFIEQDALA